MSKVPEVGRRNSRYQDWTQGSVFRNLLKIAWPMLISNTFMMLGPTIDMIWVGKLGSSSVAGVGVAGVAVQLVMIGMMGLVMGMRAMIARFIGAGDRALANLVLGQAFVIAAAMSITVAFIGIFFAEGILALFGLEPSVIEQGAAYMRIQFLGQAASAFQTMSDGAMQASGDTMTPMKLAIVYRLVHIALCPFMVFGWWVFPRLGVSGAAATSVISQSLGAALGLWVLFTGQTRLKVSLKNFRLDFNLIWRMVRIGIPSLLSSAQRTISQFIMMWFMSPFGTVAIAAHSITQRVDMVLVMPAMAFGMASGVLVGQNLGAKQPERAEKSYWLAMGLVGGVMVVLSLLLFLWAEAIVHLFSSEPSLIKMGADFLRIAVFSFIIMAPMFVAMQSLSGAGDTLPPMLVSVASFWCFVLPLAYFLPRVNDLGVYGVRWAMAAEVVVGATALTLYFRTGRWKRRKI